MTRAEKLKVLYADPKFRALSIDSDRPESECLIHRVLQRYPSADCRELTPKQAGEPLWGVFRKLWSPGSPSIGEGPSMLDAYLDAAVNIIQGKV